MNHKAYASILALVCLTLAFLTGCSSSSSTPPPPPTIAITATSGALQNCAVGTAFVQACAQPLVATVTSNGTPVSSGTVTFTAPANGASGTFASNNSATETDNIVNGVATSSTFTANSTLGADVVVATYTGATAPANFNLTNDTANTYVYYLSGQEAGTGANAGNIYFYAVAGAVTLDASGNVLGGEQDYNDGVVNTSPGEPNTPDTIAEATGALVVDPTTGVGTLTLTSSNTNVGVGGVETFAVQFVNANHALISQFDGTATSSGSLDLQTLPTGGNFAFAIAGVNPNEDSVDFGGVYTTGGGGIAGTLDVNDADGGVSTGNAFAATLAAQDSFGRTVVTGITNPTSEAAITFAAYPVGPEALRIIDVDTTDTAVGSAFGQGTNGTAGGTGSLGSSVFTMIGQWSTTYASVGQFATDGGGNIISGIADDNELDIGFQEEGAAIGGTYTVAANGYGTISITGDGDVTNTAPAGLYLVDPTLDINDPNNTTSVDVGGALIVDLDSDLPGGTGVITPQTDTTATDFTNNANPAYAAGFQNINDFGACNDCEFDMVGPFTMTTGLLSTATIGAEDSDPFGTWSGTPAESAGDSFSSTPLSVSPGYFSMSSTNGTANPLLATLNGVGPGTFDADIYQASATTLYWVEFDSNGVFLGPIEQQGSLTGVPALKRPGAKANARQKTQPIKGLGGQLR